MKARESYDIFSGISGSHWTLSVYACMFKNRFGFFHVQTKTEVYWYKELIVFQVWLANVARIYSNKFISDKIYVTIM